MEQLLFHGIPTLWLQRWTPDYAAVEWLAVVIHASCFVVPLILMFLVYKRTGARKAFELVLLQLLMFYTADLIYTFYPTRPPWMHDDVTRIIVTVYGHTAAIDNNPLAATPSLHVAVPMLFTFWFARQGDRKLRRFSLPLALWTLAIAWAVVYTGEHYMVDVLAGAALSVAICVAFDLVRKNVSALVPRPNAAAAQPSLPAGQPASAFVGEE